MSLLGIVWLPGIELPQADLSKRDLLEGTLGVYHKTQPQSPKNLGRKFPLLPVLSRAAWPPTSASLSAWHSSFFLFVYQQNQLTHQLPWLKHGWSPYSHLTEPYKSSAYNSLTGIPVPASWERNLVAPVGVSRGQRRGSCRLSPSSSRCGSRISGKVCGQ